MKFDANKSASSGTIGGAGDFLVAPDPQVSIVELGVPGKNFIGGVNTFKGISLRSSILIPR